VSVLLEINWDDEKFDAELKETRVKFLRASIRAFNRMGLFVEAKAVQNAKVNTGRLAGSIHKEDAEYDAGTQTITCIVHASASYAFYVEMGFQGHFVPFNVAPDLYYEAIRRWGWKVAAPSDVPHGPGDTGKKWLVFVKGKSQPFLRPALKELFSSDLHHAILKEEFERALAE
jgi:hypothetical protein